MKSVKLNTLLCSCLFILITLSFFTLFSTIFPRIHKLQKYALTREEKHIQDFINEVFVSDIDKQASYLNTSFERVATFAKNIADKVDELSKLKTSSKNFHVSLEYNNKNKNFEYIDKENIIQTDINWGYYSIWIPESDNSSHKIPAFVQIQLDNLSTLEPTLESICLNPNCITGIYIRFCNYGVGYTKNILKVIKSFDVLEGYYNNYIKFFTEKNEEHHWSNAYKSLYDNEILVWYRYKPAALNQKNEFEINIDFSYTSLAKRMNQLLSQDEYNEFNIIRILLDSQGNIVYLPESKYDLFSLPKSKKYLSIDGSPLDRLNYTLSKDKKVIELIEEIDKGENGMLTKTIKGEKFLVSFRDIPYNDWKIVVLAETKDLYGKIEASKKEYNSIFTSINKDLFIYFIIILLVTILVPVIILNRFFVKPIEVLRTKFGLLGKGKFDLRISENSSIKEVKELAKDFNTLSEQLGDYTVKLKSEEAKRQAIKAEMKVAWRLQESVLPKITAQFKKEEFELYAKLIPATNMSGDFYDFYFLDDETIVLVLADVSGKGLPAAFYMSMAKAIIKETCLKSKNYDPAEVLYKVNNRLSEDNVNCMFLTMYLVFYNIKTGNVIFSNAGHHEYLINDPNGSVKVGAVAKSPAIGIFSDCEYKNCEVKLKKDEVFSVYTDGIIEAPDFKNKQFGTDRVVKLFKEECKKSLNDLGDLIIQNVLDFQAGKKFDDITLVMIKRR